MGPHWNSTYIGLYDTARAAAVARARREIAARAAISGAEEQSAPEQTQADEGDEEEDEDEDEDEEEEAEEEEGGRGGGDNQRSRARGGGLGVSGLRKRARQLATTG